MSYDFVLSLVTPIFTQRKRHSYKRVFRRSLYEKSASRRTLFIMRETRICEMLVGSIVSLNELRLYVAVNSGVSRRIELYFDEIISVASLVR